MNHRTFEFILDTQDGSTIRYCPYDGSKNYDFDFRSPLPPSIHPLRNAKEGMSTRFRALTKIDVDFYPHPHLFPATVVTEGPCVPVTEAKEVCIPGRRPWKLGKENPCKCLVDGLWFSITRKIHRSTKARKVFYNEGRQMWNT